MNIPGIRFYWNFLERERAGLTMRLYQMYPSFFRTFESFLAYIRWKKTLEYVISLRLLNGR